MRDRIDWSQPFEPDQPLSVTSGGGNLGRWFWDNQTTLGRHTIPGCVRFLATVAEHRAYVLS